MIGRDQEGDKIMQFLENNINTADSGLIYLCGHPGTGKTSLLNQVLENFESDKELIVCKFNANSYREFSLMLRELVA